MPTFILDGKPIPFEAGDTIIRAAWRQGIEIPHYCWHPGLSAPANCRMCLVEVLPKAGLRPVTLDVLAWDESAHEYAIHQKPKLQPACRTQAADGLEVLSDQSEHVRKARHDVQEFLLLNHPVDCPICDQSGECKLQDYWLEHGQFKKRMRDEPIHKVKGAEFGATIVYDGERCVMCTRCVRFMAEVAKDPVLDMRERGNLNEIVVAPGRRLDGHYTFMTEHVCPVGALTTKDFRFKARVWFLRTASVVCQGCATGCNAYLDYDPRQNRAYRHRPRDNAQVNDFWMCDEGMLSYKEAHEARVLAARAGGAAVSMADALAQVQVLFGGVTGSFIAIVLSAEHSLEDNWALHELGTQILATDHVYWAARPDGIEDDILIHRDKNSNTRGVRIVAPDAKPVGELAADVQSGLVTHVISLGSVATLDRETIAKARWLSLAAHEGILTGLANVVLPVTSWAEHSGTYVNAKGLRQISEKALEPQGSSQSAWKLLGAVAACLGHEASWRTLRSVRSHLLGKESSLDESISSAAPNPAE
ncbi:MAG: 2Fe-2S iron-sulfur cluster-binding protein [Polyangiaceae bacterium]|jgi:NADH-quinone oxidoreductase subunit G